MKKLLGIMVLTFLLVSTSAHSLSNWKKYTGQGELKLSKDTFDLIEFYFSAGKYGAIYNNPQYEWERKMIKQVWKPMFMIISRNGKGRFWYYSFIGSEIDTTPNYLTRARDKCTKQGQGECFIFALKDKVVWQNGINPKKGTRIKKKDAKNGMVLTKLTELGFYDGGITKTKKIEKKKPKIKKEAKKETVSTSELTKELKELKKLYDEGVLTEEEFTKAKKKLLE
tara:strand:+ start:137 stop:811 length:675 start_codon:yes stop_codon:yes gene_type:complete